MSTTSGSYSSSITALATPQPVSTTMTPSGCSIANPYRSQVLSAERGCQVGSCTAPRYNGITEAVIDVHIATCSPTLKAAVVPPQVTPPADITVPSAGASRVLGEVAPPIPRNRSGFSGHWLRYLLPCVSSERRPRGGT